MDKSSRNNTKKKVKFSHTQTQKVKVSDTPTQKKNVKVSDTPTQKKNVKISESDSGSDTPTQKKNVKVSESDSDSDSGSDTIQDDTLKKYLIKFHELLILYIVNPDIKDIIGAIDNIMDTIASLKKNTTYNKIFLNNLFNNLQRITQLIYVSEKINKIKENDITNNNLHKLVHELLNLFISGLDTLKEQFISLNLEYKEKIISSIKFVYDEKILIDECIQYTDNVISNLSLKNIDKDKEPNKYDLIIILNLLDSINSSFHKFENNEDYKRDMNNCTLLYSYFELKLRMIKTKLIEIKEEVRSDTVNNIIIDMCEFVINIINTRFIPLDLKFNLKTTNDLEQIEIKDIFNNYLMENAKIYDPSPCKPFNYMKNYIETDYWNHHKKNYEIYYFVNDKKQLYYYSIFYKINTKSFLNPTDRNILRDLDLHQCLIMGSVFNGNEPYKYGKFLWILNKFLFSETLVNKSKIICFVKNTKKVVDEVFDFLNTNKLFNEESVATWPATTNKGVTQNVNVDTYKCKYLKYHDVSLYTKQDEDDKYINLIVKKFETPSLVPV